MKVNPQRNMAVIVGIPGGKYVFHSQQEHWKKEIVFLLSQQSQRSSLVVNHNKITMYKRTIPFLDMKDRVLSCGHIVFINSFQTIVSPEKLSPKQHFYQFYIDTRFLVFIKPACLKMVVLYRFEDRLQPKG